MTARTAGPVAGNVSSTEVVTGDAALGAVRRRNSMLNITNISRQEC